MDGMTSTPASQIALDPDATGSAESGAPTRRRRVPRPLMIGGGLAFAALALWLAARGVDLHGLAKAFGHVSWVWVAAAGAVNMVTILCQSWAWRLGLAEGGLGDVPLRHALAATWIGKAANQVLPAKLGEVIRVMTIRRHVPAGQGQISKIVGSLVAQRVVASVATAIIVASAVMFLPMPAEVPGGRWAPPLAITGAVAILFGVRRLRMGSLIPQRLRTLVGAFTEGAGILRQSRVALHALLLQTVGLLAQVVTVALLLRAFGVAAPAEASLLVLALMAIAGVVSAAPGGLGVTQFAIVAPLGTLYGVGADIAFAFSLGLQGTLAAVAIAGGLPAMLHQRLARPAAPATA
jgi:uncharacterized membrane protein YbhN (UPF0104 family)